MSEITYSHYENCYHANPNKDQAKTCNACQKVLKEKHESYDKMLSDLLKSSCDATNELRFQKAKTKCESKIWKYSVDKFHSSAKVSGIAGIGDHTNPLRDFSASWDRIILIGNELQGQVKLINDKAKAAGSANSGDRRSGGMHGTNEQGGTEGTSGRDSSDGEIDVTLIFAAVYLTVLAQRLVNHPDEQVDADLLEMSKSRKHGDWKDFVAVMHQFDLIVRPTDGNSK